MILHMYKIHFIPKRMYFKICSKVFEIWQVSKLSRYLAIILLLIYI